MNSAIYAIRNLVNGFLYVGSAVNFTKRWEEHRRSLRANRHENARLQNAWQKYGEVAFEFSILERVPDAAGLIVREQFWLDETKAADRDRGYNIYAVAGSPLGMKHTPEAREKMSAAQRRRAPPSADTRAKISAAHKGRIKSPEERAKISKALTGRIPTAEERMNMSVAGKGRKRSAESIEKTATAHRGMKRSAETRAKMRKPRSAEARERMRGRQVSAETRTKIVAANTGRKHSPETRARMSLAAMGNLNAKGGKRALGVNP